MVKVTSLLLALAILSLSVASADATIIVFTDRTLWTTALTGSTIITEDFSGPGLTAPGLSVSTTNGSISGGVWMDVVAHGGASTTWSIAGGTTGFGGDWDLSPNGAGQGIEFVLSYVGGGTEAVPSEVPNSYTGQFFGFTSTNAFLSVFSDGGTQAPVGDQETYNLDNLSFAQAKNNVVPEPGTLLLLGFGLAGLVAWRRRKTA